MICTPLTSCAIDTLGMRRTGEDRSGGLHLSEIIKSIMQDLEPKRYGVRGQAQVIDHTTELRFESGFTFEEMMEHAFAARRVDVIRPGEVELDGISGSPDGLNMSAVPEPRVVETKFTWKSMRGTPWPCEDHKAPMAFCSACGPQEWDTKHIAWLMQMKGYCHMLNITGAELWALFVNGDYQPAGSPVLRAWVFEWTREELAEQWAYFLQHARERKLFDVHGKAA